MGGQIILRVVQGHGDYVTDREVPGGQREHIPFGGRGDPQRFDPVVQAEAHELRRQVFDVAQRLPEKYRLVLTLRELQGFSYRKIARVMKISESAVETLVYRARLRFKEEFVTEQAGEDMDHRDVLAMLKPYLAGKLRKVQADAVREHLAHCVSCSRKLPKRKPSLRRALSSEDPIHG